MSGPQGQPARRRAPSAAVPAPRRPNAFTAITAGLFGLVAAVAAGYLPVTQFIDIPSGFSLGDLSPWTLVDLGAYLVAALVLLVGAVATFFRATAGAFLLIAGALIAAGAILLEPTLNGPPAYAEYFRTLLRFETFAAIDRVALSAAVLLVFVLAVLPTTFGYLRYRVPVVPSSPPSRHW
ncbi:hypothetical protein [Amycolatopsis jejuensis]|uniref:hypothetical protein n=1 Tax=Amycolatopsis jejuensis TaxID=330084 RepID=UPI000AFC5D1E|nr:hypothetical protein [Amycolatopsis jejuensis]